MRVQQQFKRSCIALMALFTVVPSVDALDPLEAGAIQETLKQKKQPFKKASPPEPKNTTTSQKKQMKRGGKKIKVNQFIISGNTLFTEAELHALIAEKEGQAMTLEEIYDVSNILTKFYRDQGFSLASAVVPAQKVSSGVIRLQVSEGIIDKITFLGNEKYTDQFLRHQLDEIAPGKPLRLGEMEREILLLDDLPGLTARSLIKPGEKQGSTSIEFSTEENPYEGIVTIDNAGSDSIGVWRITGNVIFNNPFAYGDALTIGHTHTEHNLLRNYQLGYSFPIYQKGTRVSVDFSRANFEIGGEFKSLNIDGDSKNLKVSVKHPFIRTRKDNVFGSLALVNQTSETRIAGDRVSPPDFDPHLTYLEVSTNASRVHDDQSFSSLFLAFNSNFSRNKDGLQNNALTGRLDVDLSHERAIAPNWSFFSRLVGVLTVDAQMDLTQFSVGGPGSIRGFPTSEARGDYGYFVQIEGRRFFQLNDTMLGGFKVFIDHGEIFRKIVDDGTEEDSESLTSYGIGANVTYLNQYNLDLLLTMPYRHNGREDSTPFVSDKKKDGRFWLTFSTSF